MFFSLLLLSSCCAQPTHSLFASSCFISHKFYLLKRDRQEVFRPGVTERPEPVPALPTAVDVYSETDSQPALPGPGLARSLGCAAGQG